MLCAYLLVMVGSLTFAITPVLAAGDNTQLHDNTIEPTGIVILQRDVPYKHGDRAGTRGHAVYIDTSPDDKISTMLKNQAVIPAGELGDADFAAISTGLSPITQLPNQLSGNRDLLDARLNGGQLNATSGSTANAGATVRTLVPALTGSVGAALGATTGRSNASLTGALNGLTSTIINASGR